METTLRILLVDDDPNDRALARRELRREFPFVQVEQITDRLGFDRALAAGGFELAITDYHIGWTDGLAVFQAIRLRYPECPVIMFTGTGSEEIAVEAMKSGLTDYILKSPKHLGRLSAAVRVAVEQSDQRRALRAAETRYRDLYEDVPVALFQSTPDGRLLDANSAMLRMLGYPDSATLKATNARELYFDPGDRERWLETASQGGVVRGVEVLMRRYDGAPVWGRLSARAVRSETGQVIHLNGSIEDVTQRRWQEARLAYVATHDVLTGLANRTSLEEALSRILVARGSGAGSALLCVDLDNFNLVNDTLGHAAGDQLLIATSRLIRDHLRPGDLLARIGGDVFAALLEDVDQAGARAVAERVRQAVYDRRFNLAGRSASLGISIGLATGENCREPATWLSQADVAMSKAKEQGRNRVHVFRRDEQDLARLSAMNQMVVRLKEAPERNLLVLHYQPIVHLRSGQIKYYEALLRLRDDYGRLIPPGEFIPIAESYGLVPNLTRWVVSEACRRLRAQPEARIFVNLSAQCIADLSLRNDIAATIETAGIVPSRLGFEITETAMCQDLSRAERWIEHFRRMGCRFALDDFGSGFSSFAYLRTLPVDQIKIDGSLVLALAEDPIQRALVQSIQTLAEVLGREVVAEYVESKAIASALTEMGVAYGQGYHLGRPGPDLVALPLADGAPSAS